MLEAGKMINVAVDNNERSCFALGDETVPRHEVVGSLGSVQFSRSLMRVGKLLQQTVLLDFILGELLEF